MENSGLFSIWALTALYQSFVFASLPQKYKLSTEVLVQSQCNTLIYMWTNCYTEIKHNTTSIPYYRWCFAYLVFPLFCVWGFYLCLETSVCLEQKYQLKLFFLCSDCIDLIWMVCLHCALQACQDYYIIASSWLFDLIFVHTPQSHIAIQIYEH